MTAPTPREVEFENALVEYAHVCGWLVHHTRPARTKKGWTTPIKGDKGFPDLVLARNGYVIFAELKRNTKAPVSDEQKGWLEQLTHGDFHTRTHEAYLWTPADWPLIEQVLR